MNAPDLHVRLAEGHKEVVGAGLLEQFIAHRQVRVHFGGQHGQIAVAFDILGDVGVSNSGADRYSSAFMLHVFATVTLLI